MKIVNKEDCEYWEMNNKIVYYPEINVTEGNKDSLYYVSSEKYNLENIDELFRYLQDAEEKYNEADDSYIFDGENYYCEYDEDRYIRYHFDNIPETMFNNDEFALRFFLDNDNEWCYGSNIFHCYNGVYFNVKNIDTIIEMFKNINHWYKDFFNIVSLNNTRLIDVLNEYSEDEYLSLSAIKNDWCDKDLIYKYMKKYKINKFKEKLEEKHLIKNKIEKRNKI